MTVPVQPVVLPELATTTRPMNDIERVLLSSRLSPEVLQVLARHSRLESNRAGANLVPGLAAGAVQTAGALPNWLLDILGSGQGQGLARLLGGGPNMEQLRQDSRQLVGSDAGAKGNDLLEMLGQMAPVAAPDMARLIGILTETQRARMLADFRKVMADRGGYIGPLHHGSPHEFDKFDATKMGTGEGAQAFGHGLYFSESPDVADFYRRSLTGPKTPGHVYDVDLPDVNPEDLLDWDVPLSQQSPKVRQSLESTLGDLKPFDLDSPDFPSDGVSVSGGARVVRGVAPHTGTVTYQLVKDGNSFRLTRADAQRLLGSQGTGAEAYSRLSSALGGDKAASDALRAAGVRGIRFLDQGSRSPNVVDERLHTLVERFDGDVRKAVEHMARSVFMPPAKKAKWINDMVESYRPKTRNYVVFDDRDINVLNRTTKKGNR